MKILNLVLLFVVCFCAKAQADRRCSSICKVGDKGCSWTCKSALTKSERARCPTIPPTPQYCVVGFSSTMFGTTCTCTQQEKCRVGSDGCNWICESVPSSPGFANCLAMPITSDECYPGETSSMCGTTCTCSKQEKCRVGVKGCNWICKADILPPDFVTCQGMPITPNECYPGETSSLCGTTCTCTIG